MKNKKFNFSFSYKHNGGKGAEECEGLEWEGDFEEADIEVIEDPQIDPGAVKNFELLSQ